MERRESMTFLITAYGVFWSALMAMRIPSPQTSLAACTQSFNSSCALSQGIPAAASCSRSLRFSALDGLNQDFIVFTVVALALERFFAIRTAYGKMSLAKFVADIKAALRNNDLKKAQELCDKQRGSVANVVGATLRKYAEMEGNSELNKDQKVLAIQKELEEATALEMPMLQENLPIIGTIVTLGTLMGLFGTVLGMIRSFSAMGTEGGADSSALSTGISEALVNTASGIATGALAVIAYNYFTNKIDRLTFALDEVGFSIVQTFNATH